MEQNLESQVHQMDSQPSTSATQSGLSGLTKSQKANFRKKERRKKALDGERGETVKKIVQHQIASREYRRVEDNKHKLSTLHNRFRACGKKEKKEELFSEIMALEEKIRKGNNTYLLKRSEALNKTM